MWKRFMHRDQVAEGPALEKDIWQLFKREPEGR
jgi:hypothetical protein